MIEIFDCEQGSPEWYAAKLGVPSASEFHTVLAKGKDGGASLTRKTYLHKLAGEILTGEPMQNFVSLAMERGKIMEEEARDLYAFQTDVDLQRVGFIKNGPKGCSPDSLIGRNGGIEIKSADAHIQIERLLRQTLPPEHKAQVQGNLWVTEREWWDFVSYCPKLPLFVIRVHRDNGYIANLAGAVDQFVAELNDIVERVRTYGSMEAAA